MSSNNCRFCYSSTTKLTSSISDEIVKQFLNLIPQLNITSDSQLPSTICQLCYGKAKISFDFIQKISEVQKKFKGQKDHKKGTIGLKITNLRSLSTSEALEKVQKVGTISIKKVSAINQSVEFKQPKQNESFHDELEAIQEEDDEDELFEIDGSSDEEYEEVKAESEDEEEFLEDDDMSDDNYEPASKKKKGKASTSRSSGGGSAKKKTVMTPAVKVSNSSFEGKEIIIEAPIAFSCAKCREKFPSFEALTEHMKSKVCQNEKSICKECGKTFLNKKSLYNHMTSHRPKEKYICEVCAKEYNHQFDLEAHMESVHHRVVKRDCVYRCTHCGDKFQSHLDLLEHVREHQREKKEAPRLCEICAKVCANLKAYQSHIIIHKEKKAHTCTVCGKGFSKMFLYQQHMHVHTGVKAFTCEICNRSYAKRDSLRNHKKRDHPEIN